MFVDIFADYGLIAIVVIGAAAGGFWLIRNYKKIAIIAPYVLMAGLTSLVVAKFMSLLPVQQARPFIQQGVEAGASFIDNPGFPSDHALVATVIVLAVYCITPYRRVAYTLVVLTILMSIARVLGLVHTPFDIVGGVVAGMAGVIWYKKLKQDTNYKV
jgi:membrane-associated phospholipid phosphatase